MKITNTFVIASLFLSLSAFSQSSDSFCGKANVKVPDNESKLTGKAYINKYIGKDEQFYSYWVKGTVYLTDGSQVSDKYVRYNGLLDEFLWMRDTDYQTAILNRNIVNRIEMFNSQNNSVTTFVRVNYRNMQHPENKDMYLRLLSDGKIILYKKMEVFENNSTGELIRKDFYYLYKNDSYQSFIPRRITLFRLFPEDKKTIKKIVRSNNLNIKNEAGLIKAIDLYNSQIAGQ